MEKAKVLIIEDELVVARDLADMLGQCGHEVVGIASSGEEAVEKAEATNPDLVLADIKLDGPMDGIEASGLIRSSCDAAIIFLTARTESDLFERAKQTQPHGYLTKPVAPHELLRTVEMALYNSEMERQLRTSESRLRAILDQAFHFIGLMTPEGILIEVNRAALQSYGLSESDVLGMPLWETPWWTHSAEQQQRLRKAIEKAAAGELVPFEAFHSAPDGQIRYVDVSIKPMKDDRGNVTLLVPEGRDITERKNAEAALDAERLRFKTLAENAPFGMVMIGEDGAFQYTNLKFREIFGYDPAEIPCGREWFRKAFPDPAFRHEVIAGWIEDLKRSDFGEQRPRILSATCKDGTEKRVNFRTVQLETGEHLMTCEDITERYLADEALRASEDRLRALSEATFEAIFLSEKGICIGQNLSAENMFGYSTREAVGRRGTDWILPEFRELVRSKMLEGYEEPYEAIAVRKDGTRFHCEIQGRMVHYEGRWVRVTALRDISARKQAEDALKDSEERFRTAFRTSPDSISISRLEDGVYTDINEGFTALTGYAREDVIGKSSLRINIWHDPKGRDRMVEALGRDGYFSNLEAKFRLKDGQIRTGLTSARVIPLDGEPHVLAVTRDIEDWKKTQEALRESRQRLELALTGADLGLWDWNLTTGKAVWSERMVGILGYSQARIEHDLRSWKKQVHPEDWPEVSEMFNRHIEGSLPSFEVQYRNRRVSGGWKWIQARGKIVEWDEEGRPTRMTGTALDITESKTLEDQVLRSQKMEALGTLGGGIAHDVNNLLQIILGQADMLVQRGGMNEKSLKSLQAIRRATQNGAQLVKRILTFSRKAEAQMRPIDLSEEVRRVEELLRRTIPKMIAIEMSLEDDLWKIDADTSQLEQILLNLAVNAKDAMPEGGRLVFETRNAKISKEYCALHPEFSAGRYVMLAVSDTGQGMERAVSDRIFEPFFTTKQPGEGTGLGLSTVFGIVKSHGGHTHCYSEPDVGTTFTIYFPVAEMDLPTEAVDSGEIPAGGTETILLVDDEEAVRTLGAEMLELAGYSVLAAANGREALKVYGGKKEEISLVILDLVMPEMSGRMCLEKLLRMDPDARILIASGYSSNGPTQDALASGATGFISKPFDLKQILLAVRKSLDEPTEKP
jgi:two-component system, cell cycle sensor histidine kinase and response regulator CckA